MKTFIQQITNIAPKYIHGINEQKGDIYVYIYPEFLKQFMDILKNHTNFQFKLLSDICTVDYPSRSNRFEVIYCLLSIQYNSRVIIKTYTNETSSVESLSSLYENANWAEREVWDLYGVFFSNHPDLRRILTDYGFEGHPLRKDYPLSGYKEVRYDDLQKRVVYEPLETTQEFRYFDFSSPWEETKP